MDIRQFFKRAAADPPDGGENAPGEKRSREDIQSTSKSQDPKEKAPEGETSQEDIPSTSQSNQQLTDIHAVSYDIGAILNSGITPSDLSDIEKFRIMASHFTPDNNYSFPITEQHGCRRRCKLQWLDDNFKYSQNDDAIFCVKCALFVPAERRKSHHLQGFVNVGCKSWHNIRDKQLAHLNTKYHKHTVVDAEHFRGRFEEPDKTLPNMVDKELRERQLKYKQILLKIAQAVHFCGKQGISLRGHRENFLESTAPHENPGNFIALLQEYAKTDEVLHAHMTVPLAKNANYMRPKSQNEMVEIIGHHIIQSDLLDEIKAAGFHTVSCDEVTSSNDEIMSLCFRFVDNNNNIREEFLEFVGLDRITGSAIANVIMTFYRKTGLQMDDLRGQCYDGASNMCGEKNGVKAIISEHANNAPYIHCNGHILNLSIAASCKELNIQHVLTTMKDVAIFVNYSPKREKLLEMIVNKREIHCPKSRKILVGLCKTRWSERDTAYEHFYLALPFLAECMEIITGTHPDLAEFELQYTGGWDSNAKKDALARLKAISDFGFIVGLVSLYYLLHPLHGVTCKLQGREMDIVQAYGMIDDIKNDFKIVRENIETTFEKIYEQSVRIADKLLVTPALPRMAARQMHRQNTPASTPEEYWRRTVAIPLVDNIIGELTTRFENTAKTAVNLLWLVPALLCDTSFNENDVNGAIEMYRDDLTGPDVIQMEILTWKTKWQNVVKCERPNSLGQALKSCDKTRFPNIYVLIKIACTLGVTSCECERSFSTLRRLRNWLRASMGTPRLSSLALMNIHYGHTVNYETCVKKFLELHPRRIKMSNLIFE